MKPRPRASAPPLPPPAPPFNRVAALPRPGDSAAVAKRLLPAGTRVTFPQRRNGDEDDDHGEDVVAVTLSAPCLEGHRFAVRHHNPGDDLTSWGLPFGRALCSISPGDVLVNDKMATALRERLSGPHDPEEADAIRKLLESQGVNFDDLDVSPDSPFVIEDRGGFKAVGRNLPARISDSADGDEEKVGTTFLGYPRDRGRGVGTRNHVVVIGLTGASAPLISPLSSRWRRYEQTSASKSEDDARENFDGVRIVAHTEGESSLEEGQFNSVHIHRCLAGFLCHPNVGAAVVVTTGRERHVTPGTLLDFVLRCNAEAESGGNVPPYPTSCFEPPHARFVQLSRGGGCGDSITDVFGPLDEAVSLAVDHATHRVERRSVPLSNLRLALQCGGSDAFSGLTGNPLAGAVASRLIHEHGGSAVLAESPELVGAEPYILDRVADENVARRFVEVTERYKRYGARHGTSVAGNPSGGNLYRGLYNIVLKSLGAARKKAEDVALDCVLEYGEPIPTSSAGEEADEDRGGCHYAFMDSPGNDLESIAGQVAGGCNLIIFITGNGAMTNFPFVPTIKVVTTSRRYRLLEHEMDVDAGPYGCDGGEERGRVVDDAFDLCVRVASGTRSRGEMAGHSQVSLWRNWAVGDGGGEQGGIGTQQAANAARLDDDLRTESTDHLRLFGMVEPHAVRPDPPAVLPDCLLLEPPVKRAVPPSTEPMGDSNNEGDGDGVGGGVLRPWSCGASYALIPTSLCSSAVAKTIADRFVSHGPSHHRHRRIVCPSHTEGCGAASADPAYDRTYQRLLLGTAFHPSVGRALFLEHGCEKTHNDYFRNCIREALAAAAAAAAVDDRVTDGADTSSPPIHPDSMFGFWSLQAGGGLDNAEKYVDEYFGRDDDYDCDGNDCTANGERVVSISSTPPGGMVPFGSLPWSSRPVAVGIMVDDAALLASESATPPSPCSSTDDVDVGGDPECERDPLLLASALATVVRFLSRVGVHAVLPANSPLLTPSSPCHVNGADAGGSTVPPSTTGDMEDMFAVRRSRRAEKRQPRPGRRDERADVESGGGRGWSSSSSSSSVGSLFAAEALEDGTVPNATLLAGQMIHHQRRASPGGAETTTEPGGLHVMDVPVGSTWDETVSCLGPACDVMLIVGDSTSTTTLLPGSCLVPTLRRATPSHPRSSKGVVVFVFDDHYPIDSAHGKWSLWTADTCSELLDVLRSPLICGGDVRDREELVDSLGEALFSVTTFVVPRGNAVSF